MTKYVPVMLTRNQIQAADDALANLIKQSEWLHEVSDTMDQTTVKDKLALFRLRSALIVALDGTA